MSHSNSQVNNSINNSDDEYETVTKHRKSYKRYKQPSFVVFNDKIEKYICHCHFCKNRIKEINEDLERQYNDLTDGLTTDKPKKQFYNNKFKTLKDVFLHIEQVSTSLINNVIECKVCKKYGTTFNILNKKRELDDHNKEFHSKQKWQKSNQNKQVAEEVVGIEDENIFSKLEE